MSAIPYQEIAGFLDDMFNGKQRPRPRCSQGRRVMQANEKIWCELLGKSIPLQRVSVKRLEMEERAAIEMSAQYEREAKRYRIAIGKKREMKAKDSAP